MSSISSAWVSMHGPAVVSAAMIVTFGICSALAVHAGSTFRYPDENEYYTLAANLIATHSFSLDGVTLTACRPPGYVWFLAILRFLGLSPIGFRIVNASLLVVCQLFLFRLARDVGSAASAAIAICLSLCYPVLLYSAVLLFPQTLGAALFLCALWILLNSHPLTMARAALAGLVTGMLILTIPTFLATIAFLSLWLLWRNRRFRQVFIAFCLPGLLLVGGWCLRDYQVFHTFVSISTNGGLNLLIGNSENSTANSGVYTNISSYTATSHGLSEPAADRFYAASARQWIRQHPRPAFTLYLGKLGHYFAVFDRTEVTDDSATLAQARWRRLIMWLTYGPLVMLLAVRILLAGAAIITEPEKCLLGLYFFNAFVSAAFFPRIRFRLPMDWLLLLIDAGLLAFLLGRPSASVTLATPAAESSPSQPDPV